MLSIANDVDVMAGEALPQLKIVTAAQDVSDWLAASTPNTKPKSAETLVKNANESMYAFYDGHTVGHVALKLWPEPASVVVGNERGSLVWWHLPHYGIESLVINPKVRGFGIGKLLLGKLCTYISGELIPQLPVNRSYGHAAVLASTVTCDASLPLFLGQGFEHYPDVAFSPPYQDISLNPESGKEIVSKMFSA